MVSFSKHNSKSMQRHGKQLLKSKFTKITLSKLKIQATNNSKLFAPAIALPKTLRRSARFAKANANANANTIRMVHTTATTRSAAKKLSNLNSPSPSPFKNGFSQSPKHKHNANAAATNSSSSPPKSAKSAMKSFFGRKSRKRQQQDDLDLSNQSEAAAIHNNNHIVKLTGINLVDKSSAKKAKQLRNLDSDGKYIGLPIETVESTASDLTADTTNPNTPERKGSENNHYNLENNEGYFEENFQAQYEEQQKRMDAIKQRITNQDDKEKGEEQLKIINRLEEKVRNQQETYIRDLTLSVASQSSQQSTDSRDPYGHRSLNTSKSADSVGGPHIFVDSEDENDHCDEDDEAVTDQSRRSIESADNLQALLELELERLEDKLRIQKRERLEDETRSSQHEISRALVEEDQLGNSKRDAEETDAIQNSTYERKESSMLNAFTQRFQSFFAPGAQNSAIAEIKQNRFLSLLSVIIPAMLLMHWFHSKVLVVTPPYSHDTAKDKAQIFFETQNTENPLEGFRIVVSETESKLGSTIEERFLRLGATVTSAEKIDCSDLNSVAESIDSLVGSLDGKVDFLVQTGNLCLTTPQDDDRTVIDGLKSITSTTVQGHDALFAGNYLSSFLMTQKILPHLEQSRFGTLVQFTSRSSAFVDESQLERNIHNGPKSKFSTVLYLPLQFAYAKLSELLQHKALVRTYPNIRTMEVSNGWIGNGDGGADDFFDRIFEMEEEREGALSSSSTAADIAENEDLQDRLYEWSKNAVWEWVVTPPPTLVTFTGMLMGSPNPNTIRQQSKQPVVSDSDGKSAAGASSSYFPTNTIAMVTSSTLAIMAMKAKTMASDSGKPWSWYE